MRIDPKQELYGQPVLTIREILREAMAEKLIATNKNGIAAKISATLHQPNSTAKEVLEKMVKDAYLIIKKEKYNGKFFYKAIETEKGRRLGIATANPPIPREKADFLLQELIERVKRVNENEELVYFVERVRVFGSYLTDKPLLGDLDVAVKLTRRKQGDEFMKMNEKRIALAHKDGRRFSNLVDQLYWPLREVELMLKSKKKGLSVHDEENDDVISRTESRIVYEFHL